MRLNPTLSISVGMLDLFETILFAWLEIANLIDFLKGRDPQTPAVFHVTFLLLGLAATVLLAAAAGRLLLRPEIDRVALHLQFGAAIGVTARCAWVLVMAFAQSNESLHGLLLLVDAVLLGLPAAACVLAAGLLHSAVRVK